MKGFTLLEVILSVSIIAIIAAFTPPVYNQLQSKVSFDATVSSYVSSLHRAQKLSESGKMDSVWGVKITSEKITIFKGSSFVSRDVSYDEESSILSNIAVSGDSEVIFNKLYGTPVSKTNTKLWGDNNLEANISINEKGLIEY